MGFTYGFLHFVVLYFFLFSWSSSKWIYRYYRDGLRYGVWKSIAGIYRTYYVFGQVIIDKVAMASGIKDRFNLTHNGAEFISGPHGQLGNCQPSDARLWRQGKRGDV